MNTLEIRSRMEKAYHFFHEELNKVRSNRPNPEIIEDIKVNVYNSPMPIKQLGTVNIVDPTLMTVQCWDKNNAMEIRKAIENADLGFNPMIDGNLIRIPIPPLSNERREELTKVVKKITEEARIAVRNTRHELIKEVDASEGSEDQKEREKKEIQQIVDEFNAKIDDASGAKEKELMAV